MENHFYWNYFRFLWASASTATKIGLHSAQPFVISIFRFLIAGVIMLVISHFIMAKRLPQKKNGSRLVFMVCLISLFIWVCM